QQRSGRPTTSPRRMLSLIAEFYAANVARTEVDGYPFLAKLLVHNEFEITSVVGTGIESDGGPYQFDWHTVDGRFVRVAADKTLLRDKDRTIASLLAALHWLVEKKNFNRFFSYTDEIRGHTTLEQYLLADKRWAWSDIRADELKRFISEVPVVR